MKKIVKLIGISIKRKQTKNYQNTMFKKYPKLNCLDNSLKKLLFKNYIYKNFFKIKSYKSNEYFQNLIHQNI
jgi:hypothetical protein